MESNNSLLERLRSYKELETEPTAEALAKREVAEQLRVLSHEIVRSTASESSLLEVAAILSAQRAILSGAGSTRDAEIESATASTSGSAAIAGMEDFRDRSPITGLANPLAPPAVLAADLDAEVIRGEMTFGPTFEGAPGCVHGGFVAAVLDEALGMACIFSGGPAMTAELTTSYPQHTPIAIPLRVEARLDSVDGRKIRTSGEVYQGDRVVASAKGLFIAVDLDKFARLAAARAASREKDS